MKKITLLVLMFIGAVSLHAKGDLHIFTVDNKDGKITPTMIEKAFESNGFAVGINSDIHDGISKKYNDSRFKIYNVVSIYHKKITLDLMKEHPSAGVFAPMGVSIYQTKKENDLHISILTAEAQAKILNSDKKILRNLEDAIVKVVMDLLPKAKHTFSEDSLKESRSLITQYELDLKGANWEDAKDEFEESLEDSLAPYGFVMPSYFDFAEELGKDNPFDFYVSYSICKIAVIYAVSKTRPEAAAFAPCTVMVYKKKDEDKIVTGFSAVYSWMSSAKIVDKESHDELEQAQNDFEAILKDVTK